MNQEPRSQRQPGFTLVEILVVVAIIGLMAQMIVPSFTSDVPEARVKSEALKLAAHLSYLRSEARLRAKVYALELDAVHGRYRMVLPPEELLTEEGQGRPEEVQLEWYELPEEVQIRGSHLGKSAMFKPGVELAIRFDPRGRTPQRVLLLGHRSDKELVYSIFIPPLAGSFEVRRGDRFFPTASDSDF